MRPFSYANRHGDVYYLHILHHSKKAARYIMRRQLSGALESLPEGYEIRENVHGRVYVRRKRTRQFRALEETLLRSALKGYRPFAYELDIEENAATIYASAEDRKCFLESLDAEFAEGFADALANALKKRYSSELADLFRARRRKQERARRRFYPLLRFVIVDSQARLFAVERVCFTGDSDWVRLEVLPPTAALTKYLPHLGRDSFFDLL